MKNLPAGWAETVLASFHVQSRTIDPRRTPDQQFTLYSVPSFERREPEIVTGSAIGSAKLLVEPGTVLLCKINPRINRVWVVRDTGSGKTIASSEWIPLLPPDSVKPDYLAYYLQQDGIREFLARNVSGVGGSLMRVKPSILAQLLLPLPPLAEQRRIVAEIEKQLTQIGSATRMLHDAYHRCKLYGRAVTFSGLQEAQRLAKFSATVAAVADLIQYGTSEKCSEEPIGVPVLRMGNIATNGRLSTDKLRYLPSVSPEFPKMLLAPGDLLFNRTNSAELVGKCAVYSGSPTPCSFASYLIRVRLKPSCSPQYLAMCLNSDYGRSWIRGCMSQQVGQANVSGSKLAGFEFPLPEPDIQRWIMDRVEAQMSALEAIELQISVTQTRADRLRQAILKKAFEGKLVPQNPNDEPASVLLERIRAARPHAPMRRAPRQTRVHT